MDNTHAIKTHLTKSDYATYILKGISYATYMNRFSELVTQFKKGETIDYSHAEYLPLNLQRMLRVDNTFEMLPGVKEALLNLHHPVTWLVLTEYWCGDAAQNLPVFNKIAQSSEGKITMALLFRDENEALMDKYLTDGTRSIPKLIQLDSHNNVTGIWGPRPTALQHMAIEHKNNPKTAGSYKEDVQRWYINDKTHTVQLEAVKLIRLASTFCADCMI